MTTVTADTTSWCVCECVCWIEMLQIVVHLWLDECTLKSESFSYFFISFERRSEAFTICPNISIRIINTETCLCYATITRSEMPRIIMISAVNPTWFICLWQSCLPAIIITVMSAVTRRPSFAPTCPLFLKIVCKFVLQEAQACLHRICVVCLCIFHKLVIWPYFLFLTNHLNLSCFIVIKTHKVINPTKGLYLWLENCFVAWRSSNFRSDVFVPWVKIISDIKNKTVLLPN